MFVQHHSTPVSVSAVTNSFNSDFSNEHFEIIVDTKSHNGLKGRLLFAYLHQNLEATIHITAESIRVQSLLPFEGVLASAPLLQEENVLEQAYYANGIITKKGEQNIVWLILDLIHIYNVLRLKPSSILTLYREIFAEVKTKFPEFVFGKISVKGPAASYAAKLLAQAAKRKYKYVYGNSLDLLVSFQQLLATYPQVSWELKPDLAGNIILPLS